jgi:AcrR family transcriptional regulator
MGKVKTRDRILDISLQLFNRLGEPNVTTLLISDELEISPGNLYYHFKSKSDIVEELYGHFDHDMNDLLAVPEDVEITLDQQNFFLHLLFETVARYRFIYQDLVNVLSRYDALQSPFRRLLKRKQKAFLTICESFRRQKMMQISDEELGALCEQLTLTACYWSSYDSLSHLQERDRVDPGRGVYQMLSLLLPYLEEQEQEQVRLISRAYLAD